MKIRIQITARLHPRSNDRRQLVVVALSKSRTLSPFHLQFQSQWANPNSSKFLVHSHLWINSQILNYSSADLIQKYSARWSLPASQQFVQLVFTNLRLIFSLAESKFKVEQCRNQQFQLQRADTTKQQGRNAFYQTKRRLHDEIHCRTAAAAAEAPAANAGWGQPSQPFGEDRVDSDANSRRESSCEQSLLIAERHLECWCDSHRHWTS